MDALNRWLMLRSTKRMAALMPHHLLKSYGGGTFYTPQQVATSYRALKLNPKYIRIAYAEFLELNTYLKFSGNTQAQYDQDRSIFGRYKPLIQMDSEAGPAPVNAYIHQMTGMD
jgi:hypothetical protein